MTPDTLGELLDRPIAFHRCFGRLVGSASGGVWLSQAVYWQKRAVQSDGFFYKTRDEWEEETLCTRREQEVVRAKLVQLGILEEVRRGIPRKLFFRIDFARLAECLTSPPSSRSDMTDKAASDESADDTGTSDQQAGEESPAVGSDPADEGSDLTSSLTENTAETSEITHNPPAMREPLSPDARCPDPRAVLDRINTAAKRDGPTELRWHSGAIFQLERIWRHAGGRDDEIDLVVKWLTTEHLPKCTTGVLSLRLLDEKWPEYAPQAYVWRAEGGEAAGGDPLEAMFARIEREAPDAANLQD